MNDVKTIINRCQGLGATFILINDHHIKVKAPSPLPEDIIEQLRTPKPQIIAELRKILRKQAECWFLEEWRRTSLPSWRRILKESIESSNKHREEYARWMLKEILEDPEYREEE